jgi:hypothetical protein
MAPRGKMKQRLLDEREHLMAELEALKRQASGLEIAISRLDKILEQAATEE